MVNIYTIALLNNLRSTRRCPANNPTARSSASCGGAAPPAGQTQTRNPGPQLRAALARAPAPPPLPRTEPAVAPRCGAAQAVDGHEPAQATGLPSTRTRPTLAAPRRSGGAPGAAPATKPRSTAAARRGAPSRGTRSSRYLSSSSPAQLPPGEARPSAPRPPPRRRPLPPHRAASSCAPAPTTPCCLASLHRDTAHFLPCGAPESDAASAAAAQPVSAERAQTWKPPRRAAPRGAAMAEKLPEQMSDYQHVPPEIVNESVGHADAKEELLDECESIWRQMEECQSKLTLLGTETLPESDAKLSLLMMRVKALTAEYNQWQKRSPEIISTNPEVLVALGKEELQKVKNGLEMVLSTVQSKNKKLREDLKREQQWHEEQQQIVDALNGIEEEMKNQVVQFSEKRAFQELKNKMLKLRTYKEELLNALGEFLEEHFPLPEEDGSAKKKKKNSSEEPAVELVTLHEILEILINKLMSTPHEPYLTISDSFWPPYIELLLRHGIALRHPEDPNRIRLEAFHQ
uniref:Centromere protein K n=1 Tax=Apteryx owenii TaxID=8824 RepID=A0A8B9PXR1_APTOW